MDIPRDRILELLRDRGHADPEAAVQALPATVHPERDAELLTALGLGPEDLGGEDLGDTAERLGLDDSSSAMA